MKEKPQKISRRHLTRGIAWAAPVMLASTTVPLYAASQLTATGAIPQYYQSAYSRIPNSCNATSRPQGGYVDSMPIGSPVSNEFGDDGKRDPSTSIGTWLESSASGTYMLNNIVRIWTFNHDIKIVDSPSGAAYSTTGTSTWSSPNIIPDGWAVTQINSRTLQAVFTGSGTYTTSTAVVGSGDAFGLFINFQVLSGCFADLRVTTSTTVQYTDANGPQTWSKQTGPSLLVK